jgi:hypothetical protein
MNQIDLIGIRITAGEAVSPPPADNTNWPLFPEWSTVEEFMQRNRRRKEQLSRDLADNPNLWECPEHRLTRKITLAMERCALWQYYHRR